MYSTCLFCHKPLGANEAIEQFPVGRRLAFDAAKGRLWVVCRECEQWNLSPLDERWEAIEQAEKLYRDARRRVATENVGLARLRDGTTLVRIGDPLRPEFAAWRYGDQFGRRRRRQLLLAGGGVAAIGAVVVGGAVAGVGIGGFYGLFGSAYTNIVRGRPNSVVARILTRNDGLVHVRRRHLAETSITRASDGSLALDLRFKNGKARFEGAEAERIAAIILPKVNRFGGSPRQVTAAVEEIEKLGSAEQYMDRLTRMSHVYTRPYERARRKWWRNDDNAPSQFKAGLFGLPTEHRLALEMALHEEAERRALQGELDALEQAWREAEEVAAIADDLLTPPSVASSLSRLKGK